MFCTVLKVSCIKHCAETIVSCIFIMALGANSLITVGNTLENVLQTFVETGNKNNLPCEWSSVWTFTFHSMILCAAGDLCKCSWSEWGIWGYGICSDGVILFYSSSVPTRKICLPPVVNWPVPTCEGGQEAWQNNWVSKIGYWTNHPTGAVEENTALLIPWIWFYWVGLNFITVITNRWNAISCFQILIQNSKV